MIFSVIVPHFKESESVLAKCQNSIQVAIDKFGRPDQVEILEEYGKDGVSKARNRGLARAKGRWILFIDADDVISEDYFKEISSAINASPNAQMIAWGNSDNELLWAGLWNKAYRRDILPPNGFRPYAHGEDRLFVAEVLVQKPTVAKICKTLYFYQPSETSVTTQKRDTSWIKDTLGYSRELLDVLSGINDVTTPKKLYHDIAVWTLEECSWAMLTLSFDGRKDAVNVWRRFLPRLINCRHIPVWYRFVAWSCLRFGSIARFTLCVCPRKLKRCIRR